jgi:tetratricopeptide (TPR) repeat protein
MESRQVVPQEEDEIAVRRALLVVLLVAMPGTALANPKAKAGEHIERASAAYDQERFGEALNELMTAYALDPDPELLYAIGQIHVKLGQCTEAIVFYKRFLDSKPGANEAAIVKKAIKSCETAPPKSEPPKPEPPKPEPPKPEPPQPPRGEPAPTVISTTSPWYTDVVGDVLTGAGIAAGVTGFVLYRSALSVRDDADRAPTYEQHEELVDRAKSRQTIGVAVAAGGGALVVAGLIRYFVGDRTEQHRVDVTPAADGGVVSWSGQF